MTHFLMLTRMRGRGVGVLSLFTNLLFAALADVAKGETEEVCFA